MKQHILLADDDPDIIAAMSYLLESEGYRVSTATNPEQAIAQVTQNNFSLLLMDLNYSKDTTSGREGLEMIQQIVKRDIHIPIVVMTAWGNVETAVKAMQLGARDFIQKPWENDRLLSIINNQIQRRNAEQQSQKLSEEVHLLKDQLGSSHASLLCLSPVMKQLMEQLQQVADSDAAVLLTGENGTGKSLLARFIHDHSSRKQQSFISVNMGSITETLFESEMFGHVKGAFTDARDSRIGRFELADNGTLFLDEIGNTPYSQQAKLLRVLEEHEFEKVGSSSTQQSDCRMICATNMDLDAAVSSEKFRKDLLYRINTITLRVPALRERGQDILPLADMFLKSHARKYNKKETLIGKPAQKVLLDYDWPGNVRELSHVMERALILSKNKNITPETLGLGSHQERNNQAILAADHGGGYEKGAKTGKQTLDDIEKEIIRERLQNYDGNWEDVARSLGLSKSAFYRRLEKYDLGK